MANNHLELWESQLVERIEELIELKIAEKTVEDHNGPALSIDIRDKKKEIISLLMNVEQVEY